MWRIAGRHVQMSAVAQQRLACAPSLAASASGRRSMGLRRMVHGSAPRRAAPQAQTQQPASGGVAAAEGGAPPPTTISFQQGAKAATTGTIWVGIAALVGVCGFYIAKELIPTAMSPNAVFASAFESIRDSPEVTSRLGDNIKAFGGDYNSKKEGRRNFVENHVYNDLDGNKRIRIKFTMEGSRGRANVYAEKAAGADEFAYVILEQAVQGRVDAIALLDNRPVYTRGEIQEKVVARLAEAKTVVYGHSNCQHTHRQLSELGEFAERLDVVMCDKPENKDRCEKANLAAYPTLVIRGEPLAAYMSLEQLQATVQRL